MTFRFFVGVGVLFVALLGGVRISQADPVIVSGVVTKTGSFTAASIQFSATEDFSFTGLITPFANFGPGSQCWSFACAPGTTIQLGGIASGSDVLGTVTIGGETFRSGGGIGDSGSLHLVFDANGVLPAVVEPTALLSAPFSLSGQWGFPFIPAQQPRPVLNFTGSGIVSASLAASVAPPGGWRVTTLEHRFGSDLAPIPEPSTLLLLATGLAALARRQVVALR